MIETLLWIYVVVATLGVSVALLSWLGVWLIARFERAGATAWLLLSCGLALALMLNADRIATLARCEVVR